MAAGGMSKGNSRKSGNKKRQLRKLSSWLRSQERKKLRRHKNDVQPGTKCPPGKEQIKIPFLLRGVAQQNAIPLVRDDNRLVYEKAPPPRPVKGAFSPKGAA